MCVSVYVNVCVRARVGAFKKEQKSEEDVEKPGLKQELSLQETDKDQGDDSVNLHRSTSMPV